MNEYRFVISVDLDAESLQEAYSKLLKRMNANDWESTDEAYGPDGERVPEHELTAVRLVVLDERDN